MEFECLNCCERISREELIDGRCPICGWHHDEHGSKVHEIDPSLLMLFCQFVRRIEDSLVNQAFIDSYGRKEGRVLFKNPSYRKPLHSFNLATTRFDQIKIKNVTTVDGFISGLETSVASAKVGPKVNVSQTLCVSEVRAITFTRPHILR